MSEEKLIDHVVSRLEPQILDYVEVRHPRNTANLLQIVDKYEERFMHRQIRGSSEGFRSSGPNEGNRFNTRHKQRPSHCDLTPLDYFLWGYVKPLVYADKPQTLDHLEDNIRRVIADIRPQMLEKVIENGRPDWTTSEPAVAVLCQKSYLKCNATRLFFE
ncbi:hypothetical protein TNCV_3717591 [Trichonephila clavipes]|nr:hypothetical protein TNCV_3717591 [Trichonephila clavipes]